MLAGQLALTAAAVFAGAALYVNVAEHPARLALGDGAALVEWKPSYARGAAMQAPLAIVGLLLGLLSWWLTRDWRWALGGVVLAANWPYTLTVIMPVNNRLKATDPAEAGPETRELLHRWARLHAGRTALGFVSMLIFLWASLG